MKKVKLKPYVIPMLSTFLVLGLFISTLFMQTTEPIEFNMQYVTDIILGNKIPVINETRKIINPYINNNVAIGRTFYNYKGSEEEQTKSITKYEDTYMQNTGIDYVCEETFDVLSILDGEVISVTNDETVGNVVKIQHENDYVSVYQSLSEVNVKKGDKVSQGYLIGKSGTNKMEESLKNHLHFELYIKNKMVNPTDYLDKKLNNKQEQE